MGVYHFLNVLEGDCSVIQHPLGNVTIIDVNNAYSTKNLEAHINSVFKALRYDSFVEKNYRQKKHPVNPIEYLASFGIHSVFRFVLTHPGMDHMTGIEAFFESFEPTNFWDTDNSKELLNDSGKPSDNPDWLFYRSLRDESPSSNPKRLTLYSGARGQYCNRAKDGAGGGDGLYILAPTRELIEAANERGDFNDASYVILYRTAEGRILISGDSHNNTWEHILEHHDKDVANLDLLIAPHHGRKSDRSKGNGVKSVCHLL